MLIPAVTDVAHDSEGEKRQVDNASIHTPGGFFAHLLGIFGTYGALGGSAGRDGGRKEDEEQY